MIKFISDYGRVGDGSIVESWKLEMECMTTMNEAAEKTVKTRTRSGAKVELHPESVFSVLLTFRIQNPLNHSTMMNCTYRKGSSFRNPLHSLCRHDAFLMICLLYAVFYVMFVQFIIVREWMMFGVNKQTANKSWVSVVFVFSFFF